MKKNKMIVSLELLKKAKTTGADKYKNDKDVFYIPQDISRSENEPIPTLKMTLGNIDEFPKEVKVKKLVLTKQATTGNDKYESDDKIISGLYLPKELRSIVNLGVSFEN
jgi:hypothetical protein